MAVDIGKEKRERLVILAGKQIREILETEGETEALAHIFDRASRVGQEHKMLCAQLAALCEILEVQDSEVRDPIDEAFKMDHERLVGMTFVRLFPDKDF